MLHDICRLFYDLLINVGNGCGEEHQRLFEHIKDVFLSQLAAKHFGDKRPVIVDTCASIRGRKSHINVNETNEAVRVICFSMTRVTEVQKYSVTQKEPLAMVFADSTMKLMNDDLTINLREIQQPLVVDMAEKTTWKWFKDLGFACAVMISTNEPKKNDEACELGGNDSISLAHSLTHSITLLILILAKRSDHNDTI
ncbi:hypothetical protein RF11_03679 [Thelohanellus kitauei]|uniref:Uncharacterized protein n=1 Tax=Thelohanellus kitauei TaxID=669202 RepID=A0A0C2IXY9_THEKT|nr:hypothetical protein RF11_03679 [Thelohanellus kitauei]